jgi:DNA excision repair protein ERCC-2
VSGCALPVYRVPYPKARLEFLSETYRIPPNDFLSFDAMRYAAQCLGRILRGKDDYGVMVLTDYRFVKWRNQLPRWIADETLHGQLDLSTDAAVGMARKFLRGIAQPLEIAQKAADGSLKGKDSWDLNELEVFQREQARNRGQGDVGREDAIMHDYTVVDTNGNGVNGHT